MNTCVTCKYVTTVMDHRRVPYCGHDEAIVSINVVTGIRSIASCEEMRRIEGCGVEGNLYEAGSQTNSITVFDRLRDWFVS